MIFHSRYFYLSTLAILAALVLPNIFTEPAITKEAFGQQGPRKIPATALTYGTPEQWDRYIGSPPHQLFDGDLTTDWFPGYDTTLYYRNGGADLFVFLDGQYALEKIRLWDINNEYTVRMSLGNTAYGSGKLDTALVWELYTDGYKVWQEKELSERPKADYLVISFPKITNLPEIELYGTKLSPNASNAPNVQPRFTLSETLGANSSFITPSEVLFGERQLARPFSLLNNYLHKKALKSADAPKFTDCTSGGMHTNLDSVLQRYKENGKAIVPVLQGAFRTYETSYTEKNEKWDPNYKPVYYGQIDSAMFPQVYAEEARFAYNWVDRYGANGLDLLEYYQGWNEPNKTWLTEKAKFHAAELAALISAQYDGHEQTLCDNCGVKTADNKTKYVFPAMTNAHVAYVRMVDFYLRHIRSDALAAYDILSFHYYNRTVGGKQWGASPEVGDWESQLRDLANYAAANGKQAFWSETGYDTDAFGRSKQAISQVPSDQIQLTQAAWGIRCLLMAAKYNVKMQWYVMLDHMVDTSDKPYTLYSLSGVAKHKDMGYEKKLIWHYFEQTVSNFGNYHFKTDLSEQLANENIRVYSFTQGSDELLAVWSPTETGRAINVAFESPPGSAGKRAVLMRYGQAGMVVEEIKPVKGKFTCKVTEVPFYIKFYD